MIKKILIGLAAVIVILVVVISLRPSDFKVTRSTTIAAAPEAVFPHVNDLQKWQVWSPWARLDPNAKNTFEGPVAGTGASFAWVGNSDIGTGRMTITESKPNELIRFKLDFKEPFEGQCDSEFTFKPEGNGTHVTWTMTGKNNFIGKAMSLVMDCDKMCGDQFEQGFANLKSTVAAQPKPAPAPVPAT